MKSAETLSVKSPHYISFLPSKHESPHKPSDHAYHSNSYLSSSQSTRNKDYLNAFKFDFQRNKSPQPNLEPPIKYTHPSSSKKEPTVIDMMLGGNRLRSPNLLNQKSVNSYEKTMNSYEKPMNFFEKPMNSYEKPMNLLNNLSTLNSNYNPLENRYEQSPRNNVNFEEFQVKNKLNSEMFDSIMKHIDKKFGTLENKLRITEEILNTQQTERINDKMNFENKEKEKELVFSQENAKNLENFNKELEKRDKKINEILMKVNGIENKIQLFEEKINRFQNQNEIKISNISSEIQSFSNKFIKNTKEIHSKIDLFYESPQVVFSKINEDQEKVKKNNEDSFILNQKIGFLNEEFREKMKDFNANFENMGNVVKKNNCDLTEQKLIVNKIEEDFLKLLNFYKDINEEIIKLKGFQDEIFQIKAKQGELLGVLANLKNKKKK